MHTQLKWVCKGEKIEYACKHHIQLILIGGYCARYHDWRLRLKTKADP